MSIRVMSWVWDHTPTLKGTEKLVLLALADRADDEGICWPSQNTLAEKCSTSRTTVCKVMAKLESRGFIERNHRFNDKTGGQTSDLILVKTPVNDNPTTPVNTGLHPPVNSSLHPPINKSLHPPVNTGLHDSSLDTSFNPSIDTSKEIGADAPPPQKKKRKTDLSKQRDPNLDNPAVKAYREIARITPNIVQRQMIVEKVTDINAWRKALVSWLAHGWKAMNVEGQLSFYENGGNGNGRAYAPAAQQSFEDIPIFHGRHE